MCDGWSLRVLYHDLGLLYRAEQGEDAELPQPSSWFDHRTAAHVPEPGALDCYERVLDGAPPVIDLPTDRPRSDGGAGPGAALQRDIPSDIRHSVMSAGPRWRATPAMVLTAVHALLLAKLTGVRDLVIGVPSAGRGGPDQAETVGMYVTTVPPRVRIGATTTAEELVHQIRDRTLEALRYPATGLEEIVGRLGIPRSADTTPLVQTVCAVEQLDIETPKFGPVSTRREVLPCTAAKFHLSLGCRSRRPGR